MYPQQYNVFLNDYQTDYLSAFPFYKENDKILTDNREKVDQYKSGKDKLCGFFVGQVMKVSGGTASPQLVNDILKKKLK